MAVFLPHAICPAHHHPTDQTAGKPHQHRFCESGRNPLLATHQLTLQVEKAGIYSLTLNSSQLTGDDAFTVSNVASNELMDWKLDPDGGKSPCFTPAAFSGLNRCKWCSKTGRRISQHLYSATTTSGATEKEPFDLGRESATVNARAHVAYNSRPPSQRT